MTDSEAAEDHGQVGLDVGVWKGHVGGLCWIAGLYDRVEVRFEKVKDQDDVSIAARGFRGLGFNGRECKRVCRCGGVEGMVDAEAVSERGF